MRSFTMQRIFLYTDDKTSKWIKDRAKKNGLNVSMFVDFVIKKTMIENKNINFEPQLKMAFEARRSKNESKNRVSIPIA